MELSSKLIALFSAALGIIAPGCQNDLDKPCMYGTPYADYEIKGLVTNEENEPLENIEVTIGYKETTQGEFFPLRMEPLYTGKDGKFQSDIFNTFPGTYLTLKFEDKEGIYQARTASGTFKFVEDKKKDNPWYAGRATAEVNVKLTKQLEE